MIKNVLLILLLTIQSMVYGQEFSKTQLPYLAVNYIKNAGIESGVTGYSLFNDGASVNPVDGTGGTATITLTSSTTNPLVGTRSLIVTKPSGSSHQGQGFSSDFTIANADRGKVIRSALKYEIASGTYATGDMTLWIYDVTNTKLIQPSAYTIEKSGLQESKFVEWQSSIDSNLYRLIVHISSTSTAAYSLKFDSFESGLGPKVYGSVVTDWVSYTPTLTGFGTPTAVAFSSRRVGDTLEMKGTFISGTSTGVVAQATLGFNGVNANVVSSPAISPSGAVVGSGAVSTTGAISLYPLAIPSSNFLYLGDARAGGAGFATSLSSSIAVNGTVVSISAKVPIAGWSSSQIMSNDADTRVVAAQIRGSVASVLANSPIILPTIDSDTHSSYNVSTGRYLALIGGYYRVSAYINPGTVAAATAIYISVDAAGFGANGPILGISPQANYPMNGSGVVKVNAGQYIDIRPSANISTVSAASFISIERISGPSQIAASESVSFSANTSTAAATTSAPFIYTVKDHDTHNAYSTTTGKFTAPMSGKYSCDSTITSATNIYTYLYKGTSAVQECTSNLSNTTNSVCHKTFSLLAGDTVEIRPSANATAAGSAIQNQFSCFRMGNY